MITFPEEIVQQYRDCKPAYKKVYHIVKNSIFSRQIPLDQKLTEEGISVALGVSRTPVRTALSQLRSEGILHNVTKSNVGIREYTKRERMELAYMSGILEGKAASLAAKRKLSDDEMETLWQLYYDWCAYDKNRMKKGECVDGLRDLEMQFHLMLGKASGNSFLYKSIVEVQSLMRMHVSEIAHKNSTQLNSVTASYRRVLEAIQSKDAESAELWIREAISYSKNLRTEPNRLLNVDD